MAKPPVLHRLQYAAGGILFLVTGVLLARSTLDLHAQGLARPFTKHGRYIVQALDPASFQLSLLVYLGGAVFFAAAGLCLLAFTVVNRDVSD